MAPRVHGMTALPALRQVHVEHVMGTVLSLDLRDAPAGAAQAVDAALAWLHDVDARFSTYRADSEIRRLDRGELGLDGASADVRRVLARCAALRAATGGFFDERATGRLDPSALVKGWAAEGAAAILTAAGLTDFCLNLGGDVVTRGGALPERGWRVGIQHPLDRAAVAARVWASDLAVATTGAYERGEHVLDPRSGAGPGGVLSVTVTGPDLGTADAYSTAAFAMGLDGPAWTIGLRGYEALTILADGTVLATPAFPLLDERA
jgi:thiamine biosynthesis lipoprotein